MKLSQHIFEKSTSKIMAAIMAAPTSEYIDLDRYCSHLFFVKINRMDIYTHFWVPPLLPPLLLMLIFKNMMS